MDSRKKEHRIRHGVIRGHGMFRNCQKAPWGRNIRCNRGEAGDLGGDHIVGEADPGPG